MSDRHYQLRAQQAGFTFLKNNTVEFPIVYEYCDADGRSLALSSLGPSIPLTLLDEGQTVKVIIPRNPKPPLHDMVILVRKDELPAAPYKSPYYKVYIEVLVDLISEALNSKMAINLEEFREGTNLRGRALLEDILAIFNSSLEAK